jgi:hypothetical protein
MLFDTFHRVVAREPSSGKSISTDAPDGHIEITRVGPNSLVARKVSKSPAVAGIVRTPYSVHADNMTYLPRLVTASVTLAADKP